LQCWRLEKAFLLQNRSEKANSITVPCKTAAKTRVEKTNFE
jgi:hypothetical protein